jgi:hypothetical protein
MVADEDGPDEEGWVLRYHLEINSSLLTRWKKSTRGNGVSGGGRIHKIFMLRGPIRGKFSNSLLFT